MILFYTDVEQIFPLLIEPAIVRLHFFKNARCKIIPLPFTIG